MPDTGGGFGARPRRSGFRAAVTGILASLHAGDKSSGAIAGSAAGSTSPRLRGEVGLRALARNPGEGDSPRTELLESPPHPNPLPPSGEREIVRASGSAS